MGTLDRTKVPSPAVLPQVSIAPAREYDLAGGARLTVVPGGNQPLVRLVLMWQGGTYDMERSAALTVMADAMLEGSRSMSGGEVADAVDFEGARLSTRGGEHYTGLSLLGLSDHIVPLLPVLRSVVSEPAFAPQAVDVIKRRYATSAAVRMARVSVRADRAAKELMAGNGHPGALFDTPDDFMNVTAGDVAGVYSRTIGRGRLGLHAFLGGRFSEEVEREVVAFIESMPSCDIVASPVAIVPFRPSAPQRIDIVAPEAVQSAVSMVLPAIGRDDADYIPLRLAVMALGGYFGSRLMSNIREERGLTYGISAHLLGSPEGAVVQIDAQCSAESVGEVIEQTLREISGLWERPLSADEVERLRLSAWSALASQADSPMSALDYYVTRLLVQTPHDYFQRHMEAIGALDAGMVARMARRYLSGGWSVVTCGPGMV